jgi:DNA helicase-2/ATP-dependent DNA helicase PcrA
LVVNLGSQEERGEVDLFAERYEVRRSAQRNTFTGKTHDSIASISQFFNDRGIAFNAPRLAGQPGAKAAPLPVGPQSARASQPPGRMGAPGATAPPRSIPSRKTPGTGMKVEHPKYGTGTVVRREGEGDNAKITVNFPGFGLKKLVEKYAGLKRY